jgi:hypothetical protein
MENEVMRAFKTAILIALVGMFLVSTVTAESSCDRAANLAEQAMKWRQSGKSESQAMADVAGHKNSVLNEIVRQAWDQPLYTSSSEQRRAIQDYRAKWYANCRAFTR